METCEKCLKPIKNIYEQMTDADETGMDKYFHTWCYELVIMEEE